MFEKLLAKIGAALSADNLPYVVIGGQAVLRYGEPRLTHDIDITLGVNIDRLGQVLAVIDQIDLNPLPEDVPAFVNETMVLPTLDQTAGIRVDFIFSFTPFETNAIERAENVTLSGQSVAFVTKEDLIIHKIFAGRPRDLEDIRGILLKQANIDTTYIRKWLKVFDRAANGDTYLMSFEKILDSI